ncbi:MAG: hypothetical protein IH604_21660 [Burkholderiales bacterium]|nr:hypothetical protein [Burkholderiales bacterium]
MKETEAVEREVADCWRTSIIDMAPGRIAFRTQRLMACVADAKAAGAVSGRYAAIARGVEQALFAEQGRAVPMNIDAATAVIYAELGFAPPLARGLFCLSRSVGILAHAWEQMQQGRRNKGPTPKRFLYTYEPATDAGSSAE